MDMELDELKKTWKALDERLPQQSLADDGRIEALIARYKSDTGHGLRKLLGIHRFSLWLGGSIAAFCLAMGIMLCLNLEPSAMRNQMLAILVFILVSMLVAGGWDYKTYRWIRDTRVDEMTVSEVSRRMVRLRGWMKKEVVLVAAWCILYTVFNFVVAEMYRESAKTQLTYFAFCLVVDTVIIGLFYKRIYKHLNNIKANIEELKDVCTE